VKKKKIIFLPFRKIVLGIIRSRAGAGWSRSWVEPELVGAGAGRSRSFFEGAGAIQQGRSQSWSGTKRGPAPHHSGSNCPVLRFILKFVWL